MAVLRAVPAARPVQGLPMALLPVDRPINRSDRVAGGRSALRLLGRPRALASAALAPYRQALQRESEPCRECIVLGTKPLPPVVCSELAQNVWISFRVGKRQFAPENELDSNRRTIRKVDRR